MRVSAGIVPVKLNNGKYLFLLLRSGNHWDFPKGRVEDDEDILDAALRETKEETTLTPKDLSFNWGKQHKQSDVYKKGTKFAVYFIAETNETNISLPVSEELGRPEHDEFKWVTYKKASKLVNKRIRKILDWANEVISK
jgi:bis(5'-nucleosidyl)-tetraphosphatase